MDQAISVTEQTYCSYKKMDKCCFVSQLKRGSFKNPGQAVKLEKCHCYRHRMTYLNSCDATLRLHIPPRLYKMSPDDWLFSLTCFTFTIDTETVVNRSARCSTATLTTVIISNLIYSLYAIYVTKTTPKMHNGA